MDWSDVARIRELAAAAAAAMAARAASMPPRNLAVPAHLLDPNGPAARPRMTKPIGRPVESIFEAGDSDSGESDAGESEAGESEAGKGEAVGSLRSFEVEPDEDMQEEADGKSDAGMSMAEESNAGESYAGESEAGESDAGESDAGESDAGESDAGESELERSFNFPTNEVTRELRKGRKSKLEGTFFGRPGDALGAWTAFIRFDAADDCSDNTHFLWCGDYMDCPATRGKSAVLVRILAGSKNGGNRSISPQQACYVCLLYCPDTCEWLYVTMPNVEPVYPEKRASATLMRKIEAELCSFKPLGISAAISQASRAAPSAKASAKRQRL